jgi:hypothetical protein
VGVGAIVGEGAGEGAGLGVEIAPPDPPLPQPDIAAIATTATHVLSAVMAGNSFVMIRPSRSDPAIVLPLFIFDERF